MAQIPDTGFTSPVLISDNLYTLNGTTEVAVQPSSVSCGLELQSTKTALCISRLTQTQINAMAAPVDGMIVYNSTTALFNYREAGAWTTSAGIGVIVVPGLTTTNAVVRWGDNAAGSLLNSVVLVSNGGAVTGVTSLLNGNGAIGTPSYSFTASTSTGMFSSAANTIDFSVNGTHGLQILPIGAAVNWLAIAPSAANNSIKLESLGTDVNINVEFLLQGTGAVVFPAGAAATPSVVFHGSTTTGMFSSAVNTIDFSTNGLEAFQILPVVNAVNWIKVSPSATTTPLLISAAGTDTNIAIQMVPKGTGSVIIPVGAIATPSLSFAGDSSSGIFQSSASRVDFVAQGVEVLRLITAANGVNFLQITPAATTNPVLISALGSDTNIGIQLVTKGTGTVIIPAGNAAQTSIGFAGDIATGFYSVAAGVIGVASSGGAGFIGLWGPKGLAVGATAPVAAVTNTIKIGNGTAPTTSEANTIQLFSTTAVSNALNVRTLGLASDATPVAAVALTAIDHSFPVVINGTTYYIPCKGTQN